MVTDLEPPKVDKSGRRVRSMFAAIAGRYDLLNHLLSLNIDRRWRRFTTRVVPPQPGVPLLDCCTGTGDLALTYDRAARGQTPIIASDFCRPMLSRGLVKVRKSDAEARICLIEADLRAVQLPMAIPRRARRLAEETADTVLGIDEMVRVARPGGKVAILEFSRPRNRLLGGIYLAFFRRILPRVGQALAPNAQGAYEYLPTSVLQFPDGQDMVDLLRSRGLIDVRLYPLTFGIATLYVGTKAVS